MTSDVPQRILVLGGGFAGLTFAKTFRHPRAQVTIIDRQNHHLFQPLLYQVATAGLSAPEIAQPIRSILREVPRLDVVLGQVTEILPEERIVMVDGRPHQYDYLVFGLGGRTSYFGHPEWERFAPGLKSLGDAQRIRRELLLAFERAEASEEVATHELLSRIVIIGGGPTGVELAGACAELTRHVLQRDFRRIDPSEAHVVLLEGGPRILSQFPEALSSSAAEQLTALGAEIRCGVKVQNISKGRVELSTGEVLEAGNIIWAAGVAASPLAAKLGGPTDRSGRVLVNPDLSVPGHPEIFVVGDAAAVAQADGQWVPGVSPAAMQQGRYVAQLLEQELNGEPRGRPFKYWDKGSMATIGRSAAIAKIGALEFSGYPAWLAWLLVHLVFLIGFRNQVAVLWQWFYSYVTYKRGARIITGLDAPPP